MTPYETWLLCLVQDGVLFKVALKFDINKFPRDKHEEFLEPENRKIIMNMLPKSYRGAALVGAEVIEDAVFNQ